MLIIGKKKDYYDGVVGTTGIDKSLVYDRQLIEFEENKIPILFRNSLYAFSKRHESSLLDLGYFSVNKENQKNYLGVSFFIVGFCGKLYAGWKLYSEVKNDFITTITYDFDYIKAILKNKAWQDKNIVDAYNYAINYDAMPVFRKYNTPVFIYDSDFNRTSIGNYYDKSNKRFFINPLLKDYEFYKVFDTFQAFQEIQMFLGGVLGINEKEIVEIEDKYKIAQHGFDKWSFRKEPQEK